MSGAVVQPAGTALLCVALQAYDSDGSHPQTAMLILARGLLVDPCRGICSAVPQGCWAAQGRAVGSSVGCTAAASVCLSVSQNHGVPTGPHWEVCTEAWARSCCGSPLLLTYGV